MPFPFLFKYLSAVVAVTFVMLFVFVVFALFGIVVVFASPYRVSRSVSKKRCGSRSGGRIVVCGGVPGMLEIPGIPGKPVILGIFPWDKIDMGAIGGEGEGTDTEVVSGLELYDTGTVGVARCVKLKLRGLCSKGDGG